MTLGQAMTLIDGDALYTGFEARFDRYDRDEADEFAITHPQAQLRPCPACGRVWPRRHPMDCWLIDTPARQARRRQRLLDALSRRTA